MANPIEQISAKAMGTVQAVKAGFNGLRGVFLHLAEEHGEVGSLMKHVKKNSDPQFRREHYPQIRAELLAHERAELSTVYPMLSHYEETRELVVLHNQEARQLESAIEALDALDAATPAWADAFEHLFVLVEQHVAEEENQIFLRAQAAIGEDEAIAMLPRFEAAKKAAKHELHSS